MTTLDQFHDLGYTVHLLDLVGPSSMVNHLSRFFSDSVYTDVYVYHVADNVDVVEAFMRTSAYHVFFFFFDGDEVPPTDSRVMDALDVVKAYAVLQ